MNADFEEELHEKRIDDVFAQGEVLIPAAVTEIMGWEPGTELMVSKTSEMLIVQEFLPRCIICGSLQNVKEVLDKFLCQSCIELAEEMPFYHEKKKYIKKVCYENDEDLEDSSENNPFAFQDYGQAEENDCDDNNEDEDDYDYDSDFFMRDPRHPPQLNNTEDAEE